MRTCFEDNFSAEFVQFIGLSFKSMEAPMTILSREKEGTRGRRPINATAPPWRGDRCNWPINRLPNGKTVGAQQ